MNEYAQYDDGANGNDNDDVNKNQQCIWFIVLIGFYWEWVLVLIFIKCVISFLSSLSFINMCFLKFSITLNTTFDEVMNDNEFCKNNKMITTNQALS